MLTGKKIVLGVSGGISAYKMANVASMLVKHNADVTVIMTENACNFITPYTFEVLTKNKCYVDTFEKDAADRKRVPHVAIGEEADCFLIAPASADVIGKIANGIADDMLTTTVLPANCPVLLCPSMNVHMLENKIVQDNIEKLKRFGYGIIESDTGHLACGYDGKGKLPKEEVLVEYVLKACAKEKDLKGKKVLVTAGPTQEKIDPVRYITNHSTGKMGYEIARAAMMRGAEVTLVTGPSALTPPIEINVIKVKSADEMFDAVTSNSENQDIIIKSAAVADYRPKNAADEKIKKQGKDDFSIELVKNRDILKYLGENKRKGQFICGFSMETENMKENSVKKLNEKNVDMIVANNLKEKGAGFGTDTNIITLITKDEMKSLPVMSKFNAANAILDAVSERLM